MKITVASLERFLRISVLCFLYILNAGILLGAADVRAQKLSDTKLTVNFEHQKLTTGIEKLKELTGLYFAYNKDLFKETRIAPMSFRDTPLDVILNRMLEKTDFSYQVVNNNILISLDNNKRNQRAEPGRVSGKVTDGKTGEAIPGVTIIASGGSSYGSTDIQGNYVLKLQPGQYKLEFRYIGYQAKVITEVMVKENGTTSLDIVLQQTSQRLKDVVITSSYRRESQSALYALQKRSTAITDGISAELIRRTPDRNAGDAIKRVTGVSVLDGKYAVVRGLADRYNYTLLNGGLLPSTEPDRRTFSLDLIPALAVESIVVTKTATADLPGEFAGGVVQVNTKDFPDKDFITLSLGTGFYDGQTGKAFFKDRSGKNDWIGFDDGKRAVPDEFKMKASELAQLYPEERFRISNALSKGWEPVSSGKAEPIQQVQIGYGKTFNFKNDTKFGIVALANYRKDQTIDQVERYDLARYSKYEGTAGPGDTVKFMRSYFNEEAYRYLVNTGALLNITYQFGKNKIGIKSMFNQDFETVTTIKNGEKTLGEGIGDIVNSRVVDMHPTQKTLLGAQLQGEHRLGIEAPVTFTWNVSYNKIRKYEPNQVRLGYVNLYRADTVRYKDQDYFVPEFGSVENSSKLYSDLKEDAYNINFAVSTPFKVAGQPQIVKAGAFTQFRKREYITYNLGYFDAARGLTTGNDTGGFPSDSAINFGQPIDKILSPENFRPGGLVAVNYELPANQYTGGANLASAFVNVESQLLDNLKLIYGARVEFYAMSLSTNKELNRKLPGSGGTGDDQAPIDYIRYNTDVLPSATIIYSPVTSMNVRAAYSKTLTRPEFREISPYNYFDFVSGYMTIGNPELNRGTIQNLDFRVEWFPSAAEIISASIFKKNLHDPVELTTQATTSTTRFVRTYRNVDEALVWGLEFELRKSLYFGTGPEWLRNIIIFGNYSRIHSKIMGETAGSGLEVTQKLRERPLMGQSPYLLNAGLLVNAFKNTFSFSAAINRTGRRIVVVGTTAEDRSEIGAYPDIYENPRNQLDVQLSQKLLKQRLELRLNAANLLNDRYIQYQDFDLNGKYSGNTFDGTTFSRKSFSNYTFTISYNFKK
ncbi:outer membrane receptor protein involved in Fe transport [Chitinophaga sp. W2I13]|uniref:outer membrane beta-barrel protein n=1 Tax=Chitinophaga sp. W2I13 TaxID=3373923 RepID=UPI003D1B1CF5